MAVATSTCCHEAMHFLQLAVGIALCLSWLTPSVVQSWSPYLVELSEQQQAEIVRAHNRYRMMVRPPAADMLKLVNFCNYYSVTNRTVTLQWF